MKKLVLLFGLMFLTIGIIEAQLLSQKKLLDRAGYIIIEDSSAVDTTNAEIIIFKHDVLYVKTDERTPNGGLRIYINNQVIGRYSAPDLVLDSREFNDFSNNDELREWLEEAIAENYYIELSYTADGIAHIDYSLVVGSDTTLSYSLDSVTYSAGDIATITGQAPQNVIVLNQISSVSTNALGSNSYGNVPNSTITATAVDATKTFYFTGLPFTLAAHHVALGSVYNINTSTNTVTTLPLTNISVAGDTVTLSDMSANFTANDTLAVTIGGPQKAHDESIDALNEVTYNPDYGHYTSIETLADVTNETTDSVYYVFYMESYKHHLLDVNVSGGVTVFVYATLDASLSNSLETGWVDYGTTILGAASVTDVHNIYPQLAAYNLPFMPLKILVKCRNADDTNSIKILLRKYY